MANYKDKVLLDFHGQTVFRDDGYWWKIEAWQVPITAHIPHGIRYNLTLHDQYGTRILGFDNSHGLGNWKRKKLSSKRKEHDHMHSSATDKGTPYEFQSGAQLLEDFFNAIDETIANEKRGKL